MIKINQPYDKFLATRKSQTIPVFNNLNFDKDGNVKYTSLEKPKKIIIPPLNSNINFTTVSPKSTPEFSLNLKKVPEFFSLTDYSTKLTPVQNQYNCGCCWAFACAAAINDNLVYQKMVSQNPNISPSYLMSCDNDNNKCEGGNPSSALSWIEENGIATNKFESFSWCSSNDKCTSTDFNGSMSELNDLVPKCKKVSSELKVFIKNISRPINFKTEEEIISNIQFVKERIMEDGSLLGGITVYENMLKGNFLELQKNPSAIYLDKVNYNNFEYQKDDFNLVGFHAITVIGWGNGKVHSSLLGKTDNSFVKVPYWIVRNSWSDEWGVDGYFHLAMYPYNKLCQLEKPLSLSTNNDYIGGFLFFDVEGFGYKEDYEEPSCDEPKTDTGLVIVNSIILGLFVILFIISLFSILWPFFFMKKK